MPATFRSGPTTPFAFSTDPASVRDDVLRIALSRQLTDRFTFMNSHIKGLTQNLKDAEGRYEEFQCQMNNHLNAMRADDMDTRDTEQEHFLWMENMLKTLLQQTEAYNHMNKALIEAQHTSRTDTTLLRAEIETLMRKLEDYTTTPPPFTHHPNEQSLSCGGNICSDIHSTIGYRGCPGRSMQPHRKEDMLTEQRLQQHRTAIPYNMLTTTTKMMQCITDPWIDVLATCHRRCLRKTRCMHATVYSTPDCQTVNHHTTPYPDVERQTRCTPT
jgi:hypothetical protein